jgi:hypothetical protein
LGFFLSLPEEDNPGALRGTPGTVLNGRTALVTLAPTAMQETNLLRKKLRVNPRDGMSHVDIAQAFAISGNDATTGRHLPMNGTRWPEPPTARAVSFFDAETISVMHGRAEHRKSK